MKKSYRDQFSPQERAEYKENQQKEVMKSLSNGIQALIDELGQGKSERLVAYLNFSSKFPHYSPNNHVLIWFECMLRGITPRYVASKGTWWRMGYYIKKGERGIAIIAPAPFKKVVEDEDGNEEVRTIPRFTVELVYADCQMAPLNENTPPFPEFFVSLEGNCDVLYERLARVVKADGITIVEEELGGPEGVSSVGKIALQRGLASTNKWLTLIHEYAHEMIHDEKSRASMTKQKKECHAEAVAYVVSYHFGISNPFSSDYLQNWGNDVKTLQAEMNTVLKCATAMIEKMEALEHVAEPSVA